MSDRPAILYISYDGMLEPLGQSQVLGYLERLADTFSIHLISFEKRGDWHELSRRTAIGERLVRKGIAWHPLRYHKRPTVPATLFDIAIGCALSLWLTLRFRIRLIHARSTIPALMALAAKRLGHARLLFDIRGFWADERVDGGMWPAGGILYRAMNRLERYLYRHADHIVTLTEASRPSIMEWLGGAAVPVTVIPTCADLERFSPAGQPRPAVFTLGYLGSIGTWYCFDDMLACFRLIQQRRPDARLLVVNRNEQAEVHAAVAHAGIDPAAVEVVAAEHAEVPALVRRMTAGAMLIRPAPSKRASAPTKLAEYLGCGVPCLGNAGVGDVADILTDDEVGVVLRDLTPEARAEGVDRLLALCEEPGLAGRCRSSALRRFSIDAGVACYRRLYDGLAR